MKYEMSFKSEKKDTMLENLKRAMELLESEKEDEETEGFECNGDCENCENYVEENDPEDVLEDLARTISCLVYYDCPIPMVLAAKYNLALVEAKMEDDADDEDS